MKKQIKKENKKNKPKLEIKNLFNYLTLIFVGLAIIAVIFLIIFSIINKNSLKKEKNQEVKVSDATKFKNDYENLNNKTNDNNQKYPEVSISDDNVVKYTSYKEINSILDNKKTAVIYFGFKECPWCRNAVPVLLQAVSSTGLDKLYYLDIKNDRNELKKENGQIKTVKEGKEDYNKLVSRLSDKLDVYEGLEDNTIKRIYAPTVMFIKNGEVVSIHTSTVESQKDPYNILDKNQRKELYEIYKKAILDILDSSCDEAC